MLISRNGREAPDTIIAHTLPGGIFDAKVADKAAVCADSALKKERLWPCDRKKDVPGDIKDAGKGSVPVQAAK